jgi:hypothetical protein
MNTAMKITHRKYIGKSPKNFPAFIRKAKKPVVFSRNQWNLTSKILMRKQLHFIVDDEYYERLAIKDIRKNS